MTITIDLSPELEYRLRATAAASGVPPETIVVGALAHSLQEGVAAPGCDLPRLSTEESKLLAAINQGLSESQWQRYHDLIARRQEERLTENERQELISLCNHLEQLNVARLEKLTQLAKLRGVSLDQVMSELGIGRTSHG